MWPRLLVAGGLAACGSSGSPSAASGGGGGDGTRIGSAEHPAASSASAASTRRLDWNGDGIADVAVAAPDGVRVYLGVRSGSGSGSGLRLAGPAIELGAQQGPPGRIAAAGDVDGDGRGDVVIGAPRAVTVVEAGERFRGGLVLVAFGGAAQPTAILQQRDETEAYGVDVAIADLDADGAPDAIVAATGGRHGVNGWRAYPARIVVHRGRRGGFDEGHRVWDGPGPAAIALAAGGDLDGDGDADAVVVLADGLHVLAGGRDLGGLGAAVDDGRADPVAAVAVVPDLDGDGGDDVIVTDHAGATILRGGRDGLRRLASIAAAGPPQSYAGDTIAAGDFDGDGAIEVAFGAHGDRRIDLYRAAELRTGGTAAASLREPAGAVTDTFPAALHAGDFDGDGVDDLVAVARGADGEPRLVLYRGGPAGLTLVPAPAPAP